MSRIGIQIGASTAPAELAGVVATAERLGYGEVWLAENYFELGGIASAAVALAATERVKVGLGVLAAGVRNPAVTAMEFATLAEAFPNRFMAGLGHGAPGWIRQMGLKPASLMGLLREATDAIVALLDGESVTQEGTYFQLDGISLDHPPSQAVPLYFGVQGPASLRLSGELADGTLLGWFSSPSSVVWARQRIGEGRARRGSETSHEVVVLCLVSMSDEDPDGAGRKLAQWSAGMLGAMAGSQSLAETQEGDELKQLVESVDVENIGEAIPLDLLRRFVATGTRQDCANTVAGLLEAGADRVILVPNPAGFQSTAEMLDQMTLAQSLLR